MKRPNVFQRVSPRVFFISFLSTSSLFSKRFTFILLLSSALCFIFFSVEFSPSLSLQFCLSKERGTAAGAINTAGNKKVTERLRPADANSREEDT